MNSKLVDQLQVWGFEEGKLIFKDLSLGSVLELTAKDISCSTDEYLNSLKSVTCDFLNGLPEKLSIQFVQMTAGGSSQMSEDHASLLKDSASRLSKSLLNERVQKISDLNSKNEIIDQKLYVVIRRSFVNKIKTKKKRFRLFKKDDSSEEYFARSILEPELKLFSQMELNIQKGFETLGIKTRTLSEGETYSLLYKQWNPDGLMPENSFDSEDFRDGLLLNDFVITSRGFMLGQTHHRVLSLKIMPERTFASMAEKLRELPFGSNLFLTIQVLDQASEDLALKTQRRIAYSMYSGQKGIQDLDSAAKLQDIEAVLSKRVSGETKIFSVSLTVLLKSENEHDLDSQVASVLAKFRELSGSEGMLESLAASPIFFDLAMPNARCRDRSRRMNTEVLADFLPIFGDWKGHQIPRLLLRNRSSGLIGFDPFSPTLTNFNQVISGGSGAGKSFSINVLITHLMKEDPKVFILDIGGSYKKTTENFGGQYIPIGADSKISINPFDLSDQSIEAMDQKIKFLTSLVELMTKEDDEKGIRKLERSEIETIIKMILRDKAEPKLSDLKEVLLTHEEPSLKKMGKILEPWCGDSPYGKFIDQKSNLTLSQKIVCFDLKGLESQPDLQAVCLFLITDLIWREVQKDRINAKFVVFDECWQLLESDAGARFLESVFRTFRKYKASAIAISQAMEDFSNSKVSSAILPNSSVKWILKQTGGDLGSLQKVLNLNSREIKLVESVTSKKGFYSEAFLIAGDDKQLVKIESTPLEYWLSTTDPVDLKALDDHRLEYPNNLDLFRMMANKYPNGAF